MAKEPIKICILGGGFGGLYTALYLSRFAWVKRIKMGARNAPLHCFSSKSSTRLILVYIQRLPTHRHRLQVFKHLLSSGIFQPLFSLWWRFPQLFAKKILSRNYQKRSR
jgi:hypothetical protein